MLYDRAGNRKYLTAHERRRFMVATHQQPAPIETFCLTLAYTGARLSEVLSLGAGNIDLAARIVVFESLKKRRQGVYRHVPVPQALLSRLDAEFQLAARDTKLRLWPWSRTTAWKHVKAVMAEADIPSFCAMPKALRHSFGVVGISEARVPLNMMQKWLGHSRIETTAIYANAVGPEERAIARRMWRERPGRG
jgi:integrase